MAAFLLRQHRGGRGANSWIAPPTSSKISGDLMRTVTPRSTCGHGRVLLDRAAGACRIPTRRSSGADAGDPEGQTYALWHRGEALSALGRDDLARTAGNEALAIATRNGHRGWTATSWRAIGIAEQNEGDPRAALARSSAPAPAEHLDLFACWAAARAAL